MQQHHVVLNFLTFNGPGGSGKSCVVLCFIAFYASFYKRDSGVLAPRNFVFNAFARDVYEASSHANTHAVCIASRTTK
eukprot:6992417-Karenia_brevis.AAC.1